jgi:hypothetical protein
MYKKVWRYQRGNLIRSRTSSEWVSEWVGECLLCYSNSENVSYIMNGLGLEVIHVNEACCWCKHGVLMHVQPQDKLVQHSGGEALSCCSPMGFHRIFFNVVHIDLFSRQCCGVFFVFFIFVLCRMPNVACVSESSNLEYPFGFLKHLLTSIAQFLVPVDGTYLHCYPSFFSILF